MWRGFYGHNSHVITITRNQTRPIIGDVSRFVCKVLETWAGGRREGLGGHTMARARGQLTAAAGGACRARPPQRSRPQNVFCGNIPGAASIQAVKRTL